MGLGLLMMAALCSPAAAYVEAPFPLGKVIGDSTNVLLMQVEKVDKEKNLIIYRKVRDIKGTHPGETIKHNIGRGGFHPREWQNVMAWAEVGQMAVFFHNGGASETCINNYWYQAYAGDWWGLSHAEPFLLRSYAGKPERLATYVAAMLAGQEVVVPCMVDGDKNNLHLRTAKLQRMKASLKLQDYNPQRDFAGWGAEEFRPVLDMPGFSQYSGTARVDPGAVSVAVADFDGDKKMDLCLYGLGRAVLLQNAGGALNELPLPIEGGARAAAWGDFNNDGKVDLLLATADGPRLLLNEGAGKFKDITASLPKQNYYNTTACAWIDYDGDGKLDILLADGFRGLRLYRNKGGAPLAGASAWQYAGPLFFEDVSDAVGLGERGAGGNLKGDSLAVADVNNDGRADVLYSAGAGLLLLNTPQGFVPAKDCGIAYRCGNVAPVFGDYDGDKLADVFVPQAGKCRLFKNAGGGKFAETTDQALGAAANLGIAACAVWTDFSNSGKLDLVVGCLRGPNRYLRNNGNGTFSDATDAIGLSVRVFNTRGLAVLDLNNDGVPDVVFNNEGQESSVLLGSAARLAPTKVASK